MADKTAEKPEIDFLIGIPAKTVIDAIFDENILNWAGDNPLMRTKAISNRVDFNRNILWGVAKEHNMNLLMIDTDVVPITPYKEAKKYIFQDFKNGYDVVYAPLLGHTGNLLFAPKNKDELTAEYPYEAYYSGMGFTAINKKLIARMQPLTHAEIIDEMMVDMKIDVKVRSDILEKLNTAVPEPKPLIYEGVSQTAIEYMSYTPIYSEDTEFSTRIRKMGIRAAIDPRIKCGHMTDIPLQFNVEAVKQAIEAEKQKQIVSINDELKTMLEERNKTVEK